MPHTTQYYFLTHQIGLKRPSTVHHSRIMNEEFASVLLQSRHLLSKMYLLIHVGIYNTWQGKYCYKANSFTANLENKFLELRRVNNSKHLVELVCIGTCVHEFHVVYERVESFDPLISESTGMFSSRVVRDISKSIIISWCNRLTAQSRLIWIRNLTSSRHDTIGIAGWYCGVSTV